MIDFDYACLLHDLEDIGVEKVDDSSGDYIQINTDFRRAVTVSPGDDDEKVYLIEITTWDGDGDSNGKFVAETDDYAATVEWVRKTYKEEEDRVAAQDLLWAHLDEE